MEFNAPRFEVFDDEFLDDFAPLAVARIAGHRIMNLWKHFEVGVHRRVDVDAKANVGSFSVRSH